MARDRYPSSRNPKHRRPFERWYVLIVMCLVYAINIAARYVVTTVFEPIRLELHLDGRGRGVSDRRSSGLLLCGLRNPHRLARRPLESAQHRGGIAHYLVRIHGVLRLVANLLAAPGGAYRRGRSGKPAALRPRHSIVSDYFPPRTAPDGADGAGSGRARSGPGWAPTWPAPSPDISAGARLFLHSGRRACCWAYSCS